MRNDGLWILVGTLAGLIGGGTVFYHIVEDWSWVDSFFFTVVTLSTVGYGSLVPQTVIGKLATTVFIFAGLGVFAAVIRQVSNMTVERRMRARAELRQARRKTAEAEKRLESLEGKGPDA
ncbi:MAG: potassium channel family protein [Salibaculum sp.]|uniref:potassium channel family protein n=1 Tax=Roseovarius halophilus (ex Wu et al. 2025) TaxID=3376060 RepID=UPI0028704DBC|nr:potassium channel family protein [Salibaculum sp.]MDR9427337.1 potassium channel family protein [Salibaculum sp.]MDR9483045.1 potassium channel family protein [Salibaculum sp.]